MLAINISTPKSIMQNLKDKFKQKRLSLNLTQEGLSNKSGVSLGSIKRFETSGEISNLKNSSCNIISIPLTICKKILKC